MHHFIYPTKTVWISNGSSHIDGTSYRDQNFGKDEILELKKEFWNLSFDYPTRVLVQFSGDEFTELSKSVADGTITSDAKYYLRLYEAEGNAELTTNYKLAVQPLSEAWVEGTGKFGDNPKNVNGCSWENRRYPRGGSATSWTSAGGTITTVSHSVQTFNEQSPDVNVEITDMVNGWLGGQYGNYGMLVRFSGSQETDTETFGQLKFFSRNTNTIYSPKLEVRWDDHSPCTGSNTGSLLPLSMSGLVDNYIYPKHFKYSYKEDEKVKFRFGARKRYIQKSFSTSVQTVTGSFIAEGSGSYSILDLATGETIVPFSAYTSMSCDSTSNYFIQWLNGFQPDRIYKILLKLKYGDGQEHIIDDDFEFKVVR